jgi:hypothetical protein
LPSFDYLYDDYLLPLVGAIMSKKKPVDSHDACVLEIAEELKKRQMGSKRKLGWLE